MIRAQVPTFRIAELLSAARRPSIHPTSTSTPAVSLIVNLVANGMTAPQIVAEYPDLEEEDVAQALKYAAWITDDQFLPATETASGG